MKPPPGAGRRAGVGYDSDKSTTPCSTTPVSVPSIEVAFTRREECRKGSARVWATYYFVDGIDSGWGVLPIDRCQRPDRCGDKVIGIDDDDLGLVWCPVAGAA